MAEFLSDGSVVLSLEEMMQLQGFTARAEALVLKYEDLKNQHRILKQCHEYSNMCRDAFEAENIKLREQLKSDQFMHLARIEEQTTKMNRQFV